MKFKQWTDADVLLRSEMSASGSAEPCNIIVTDTTAQIVVGRADGLEIFCHDCPWCTLTSCNLILIVPLLPLSGDTE